MTDKLNIIAGLRYDYEKKKYAVLGEYQKDPDPNPIFETQPDTSATAKFSAFPQSWDYLITLMNKQIYMLLIAVATEPVA